MASVRRAFVPVAVLCVLVLASAACERGQPGADDAGEQGEVTRATDPPDRMPDWLNAVEPVPANQATGTVTVTVDVDLETANHVARLVIDGTDVTAAAVDGDMEAARDRSADVATPSRLVYDPRQLENPPAPLDPGVHVATVELLHYPEGFESGIAEEEGSFTWSFEVL